MPLPRARCSPSLHPPHPHLLLRLSPLPAAGTRTALRRPQRWALRCATRCMWRCSCSRPGTPASRQRCALSGAGAGPGLAVDAGQAGGRARCRPSHLLQTVSPGHASTNAHTRAPTALHTQNGKDAIQIHFTYGNDFDSKGAFTPGKVGAWHWYVPLGRLRGAMPGRAACILRTGPLSAPAPICPLWAGPTRRAPCAHTVPIRACRPIPAGTSATGRKSTRPATSRCRPPAAPTWRCRSWSGGRTGGGGMRPGCRRRRRVDGMSCDALYLAAFLHPPPATCHRRRRVNEAADHLPRWD